MKTYIQILTKLAGMLLFSAFLLTACSKNHESINRELEKPSLISPKAYIAGREDRKACYWKDGVKVQLEDAVDYTYAQSKYVSRSLKE